MKRKPAKSVWIEAGWLSRSSTGKLRGDRGMGKDRGMERRWDDEKRDLRMGGRRQCIPPPDSTFCLHTLTEQRNIDGGKPSGVCHIWHGITPIDFVGRRKVISHRFGG